MAELITQTDEALPTAEALGSYYEELLTHNVPPELAHELVRDAGFQIHRQGLTLARKADA